MNPKSPIRVAAAQCHVNERPGDNLGSCLRLLSRAAEDRPDLVVLPEFCNHLSWYEGPEHCWDVSLDLDGPWLGDLREAVRAHGFHAVVNVTLRRKGGQVTGTSLLYAPDGELLGSSDKQVLIGHENDFLQRAQHESPVVETPLGRLGLYACMDGVINETPRCLALRGAQVLCNSLNSFASDEGSLHIPVRAAENRVFVVAANKVGPLIPEMLLEPVSEATGIPVAFLDGAGESQVVAPDGTVLAMAPRHGEAVVCADIHPEEADEKRFEDGTAAFGARRPDLYGPISEDPAHQSIPPLVGEVDVPMGILGAGGDDLVGAARDVLVDRDATELRWLVLPERAGQTIDPADDPDGAVAEGAEIMKRLASACGAGQWVSTSVARHGPQGLTLAGVLIGSSGPVLIQDLVHESAAHPWAIAGASPLCAELDFGRVAVVPGPDSRYPELFRLLALQGVEIAAVSLAPAGAWELETGLLERSAENRINLAVAARPGPLGPGFITRLQGDFTVLTPWAERAFDGLLSQPEWFRADADGGLLLASVAPQHTGNKVVSRGTDLLSGRPWWLTAPISAASSAFTSNDTGIA